MMAQWSKYVGDFVAQAREKRHCLSEQAGRRLPRRCFGLDHSWAYGGWLHFAPNAGGRVKPKTNTDRPWR